MRYPNGASGKPKSEDRTEIDRALLHLDARTARREYDLELRSLTRFLLIEIHRHMSKGTRVTVPVAVHKTPGPDVWTQADVDRALGRLYARGFTCSTSTPPEGEFEIRRIDITISWK